MHRRPPLEGGKRLKMEEWVGDLSEGSKMCLQAFGGLCFMVGCTKVALFHFGFKSMVGKLRQSWVPSRFARVAKA